jgi:AraC-like DNA-binding protein
MTVPTSRLSPSIGRSAGILSDLRSDLARYHLKDPTLSVLQIAWLVGFQEVSAFTHGFKRLTGQLPKQQRSSRLTPVQ